MEGRPSPDQKNLGTTLSQDRHDCGPLPGADGGSGNVGVYVVFKRGL